MTLRYGAARPARGWRRAELGEESIRGHPPAIPPSSMRTTVAATARPGARRGAAPLAPRPGAGSAVIYLAFQELLHVAERRPLGPDCASATTGCSRRPWPGPGHRVRKDGPRSDAKAAALLPLHRRRPAPHRRDSGFALAAVVAFYRLDGRRLALADDAAYDLRDQRRRRAPRRRRRHRAQPSCRPPTDPGARTGSGPQCAILSEYRPPRNAVHLRLPERRFGAHADSDP